MEAYGANNGRLVSKIDETAIENTCSVQTSVNMNPPHTAGQLSFEFYNSNNAHIIWKLPNGITKDRLNV
eukprot:SAG22_NODE_549_length_9239_cov_7.477899_7_plen_69_part_00